MSTMEARYSYLYDYDGVYVQEYTAGRYYTEGGIGVHMIGYVLPIGADEATREWLGKVRKSS